MNTNQDTTLTNQDAFKKWRESPEGIEANSWSCTMSYAASENFNAGFKAATKASESEINSLKERVKELQSHLSSQSLEIAHNDVTLESYAHKVAELQASNNKLREALETAKYELEMQGCNEPYADENSLLSYSMVKQALSSTPAQSLAEHDNEVIERIALALEKAEGEFKTLPEYVALVRWMKND